MAERNQADTFHFDYFLQKIIGVGRGNVFFSHEQIRYLIGSLDTAFGNIRAALEKRRS